MPPFFSRCADAPHPNPASQGEREINRIRRKTTSPLEGEVGAQRREGASAQRTTNKRLRPGADPIPMTGSGLPCPTHPEIPKQNP